MGKSDKYQSVRMGVDFNVNTFFLNSHNENMAAETAPP